MSEKIRHIQIKFHIEVNIFKLGVFNNKYMLNFFSGLEVWVSDNS